MAPTQQQLNEAEAAWASAGERLAELIRETRQELERRDAALEPAEAGIAAAAESAVEQALDAIREQARADARHEAATWMASLIQSELEAWEPNSSNARTLRRLLVSVRGWSL